MTHKEIMEALLDGKILTHKFTHVFLRIIDGELHCKNNETHKWNKNSSAWHLFHYSKEYEIYEPKKIKKEKTFYISDNGFELIKNYDAIDLHGLNIEQQNGKPNKVTISWEEDEEI